jgi:hypothetical protein
LTTEIDPLIARSAWDAFASAFNLSSERAMLAIIGGMLIWLVFFAFCYIISNLIKILMAP